jgi:putative transposase
VGLDGVPPSSLSERHRFPGALISHAVWLDYRFLLSYRDVAELLAEQGVVVSDETIRSWYRRFGQTLAAGLRRRWARAGDKWHLDEVQLKITGRKHCLWQAVYQDGLVIDILVQDRRDQHAAGRSGDDVTAFAHCASLLINRDKMGSF